MEERLALNRRKLRDFKTFSPHQVALSATLKYILNYKIAKCYNFRYARKHTQVTELTS